MSTFFSDIPDDWLALAWCAVTMGLCLLLIHVAGLIRSERRGRTTTPAHRLRPFATRQAAHPRGAAFRRGVPLRDGIPPVAGRLLRDNSLLFPAPRVRRRFDI